MLRTITKRFKACFHLKRDGSKKQKVAQNPTVRIPTTIVARFPTVETPKVETPTAIAPTPKVQTPTTFAYFHDLPTELKQKVAFFLPIREARNLATTCWSIRSELDLKVFSSRLTDCLPQKKVYCTSLRPKCIAVVVPNQESRTYCMRFTCRVRLDEIKPFCKIWIVEQELPLDPDPENQPIFRLKNVVAMSQLLDDKANTRLALAFAVQPKKMYQLYVRSRKPLRFESTILHCVGYEAKKADYLAYQVKQEQSKSTGSG